MINFVVVSVILGLGYVVCHTKIIQWQRRKGKKKKVKTNEHETQRYLSP